MGPKERIGLLTFPIFSGTGVIYLNLPLNLSLLLDLLWIVQAFKCITMCISQFLQHGHLHANERETTTRLIQSILLETNKLLIEQHGWVGTLLQAVTEHSSPVVMHESELSVIIKQPFCLLCHFSFFDFTSLLFNARVVEPREEPNLDEDTTKEGVVMIAREADHAT